MRYIRHSRWTLTAQAKEWCTHSWPPGEASVTRECEGQSVVFRGGDALFHLVVGASQRVTFDLLKEEKGCPGLGRRAFQPEGVE